MGWVRQQTVPHAWAGIKTADTVVHFDFFVLGFQPRGAAFRGMAMLFSSSGPRSVPDEQILAVIDGGMLGGLMLCQAYRKLAAKFGKAA